MLFLGNSRTILFEIIFLLSCYNKAFPLLLSLNLSIESLIAVILPLDVGVEAFIFLCFIVLWSFSYFGISYLLIWTWSHRPVLIVLFIGTSISFTNGNRLTIIRYLPKQLEKKRKWNKMVMMMIPQVLPVLTPIITKKTSQSESRKSRDRVDDLLSLVVRGRRYLNLLFDHAMS